jgi:U3 small nucleolar RNA-associated protein 12
VGTCSDGIHAEARAISFSFRPLLSSLSPLIPAYAIRRRRLLTASDDQIRVYKLGAPERIVPGQKKDGDDMEVDGDDANKEANLDAVLTEEIERRAVFMGALERKSKERPSQLRFRPDGSAVALQSSGKTIEFLKVYNQEEVRQKRRKRKRKEKQKRKGDAPVVAEPTVEVELPSDEFAHKQVLRTQHKIQSFAFSPDAKSKAVLVSLQNNSIELYKIRLEQKASKPGESAEEGADDAQEEQQKGEDEKRSEKVSTIDLPGHRADIRALAISSNDEMILSASNSTISFLFNRRQMSPLRWKEMGSRDGLQA